MFVSKILKTENTTANTLFEYSTTNVCETIDLSAASIVLLVGSTISVSPGIRLAIKCSNPAFVRKMVEPSRMEG